MKTRKASFDGFGTLLASAGVLGLFILYLPLWLAAPPISVRVGMAGLIMGSFYGILWILTRYHNLTKRLMLVAALVAGNYLLTFIGFLIVSSGPFGR